VSASVGASGVSTQTFSVILDEIVASLETTLSLTTAQANRIRTSVQSGLGQWARIQAEREAVDQEALALVYGSLGAEAEGTNLDRVFRLLGLERRAATRSRVTGTATGTAATSIPNGTRVQYDNDGTVWVVADGPYTIGGGGTVTGVVLEREVADTSAPGASTDWTILDVVVGFSSYESTAQPVIGAPVETDAEFRVRATTEAYRRALGPTEAIEAAVSSVDGVTYVAAWDNPTSSTDADGIPAYATNVVVEGGDNEEIVTAILNSRGAGAEMYGLPGGTLVEETRNLGGNKNITIQFNRVEDVDMYIRCTITTSTSEDATPAGITDTVAALLLEQAPELYGIGDDVLPWRLEAVIHVAGYPGIDSVLVEVSDDGVAWQTAKYPITIRQRSVYDAARITVLEN